MQKVPNKWTLILFLFAIAFSHGSCDVFFVYHEERISLHNKKESYKRLDDAKIKLYLKEYTVYVVGLQADIIHFLYESKFKLKSYKKKNDEMLYEYSLGCIVAKNGVKEMRKIIPDIVPEEVVYTNLEDVFSIAVEKKYLL